MAERQIRLAFASASSTALSASSESEPSKRDEKTVLSKSMLNKAIDLLSKSRGQRSSTKTFLPTLDPELLVIAAETCLKCSEFVKAREIAVTYFKQMNSSRCSPDQFYCRALFVMAKVRRHARGNGDDDDDGDDDLSGKTLRCLLFFCISKILTDALLRPD